MATPQENRISQINRLAEGLGVTRDKAGAALGQVISSRGSPFMSHADTMALIEEYIAEQRGDAPPPDPSDLDTWFDGGSQPSKPARADEPPSEIEDAPSGEGPSQPAPKSKPVFSLPSVAPVTQGYCMLPRFIAGEEVVLCITADTDVALLIEKVAMAISLTDVAPSVAAARRSAPQEMQEGQHFTYGVDNHWKITKVAIAKKTFEGVSNTYIEFWATGRDNPELTLKYSDDLVEKVQRMTGHKLSFNTDIVGAFAMTVKLGYRQIYKQDVPKKGKKKGDPKDYRYPSGFWQEFVEIKPLEVDAPAVSSASDIPF